MRLVAEFTTEPFHGEDAPPAHAVKALQVAQAAGLDCDFGPLGTSVRGDATVLLAALGEVMTVAFANGATRITVQVEQDDDRG